jgi:hypothetical protein
VAWNITDRFEKRGFPAYYFIVRLHSIIFFSQQLIDLVLALLTVSKMSRESALIEMPVEVVRKILEYVSSSICAQLY